MEEHDQLGFRLRVVRPDQAAPGKPWIWRMRFFGHQPQTERALLARGFHLVYADLAGLFASPEALRRCDSTWRHVTGRLSLHRRAVLLGMSRGGLVALRWASHNPDKVACLYLDAPVCDIRSWPGGKGKGKHSPREWQACLRAHGLEEPIGAWPGNPIHEAILSPLAEARTPILSVCGAADEVVPVAENTAALATTLRRLGGRIRVLTKPGIGHHLHSLKDPAPILRFILRHTLGSGDSFVLRRGCRHARARFAAGGSARVAFLGGSITHNPGWRELVMADLRGRFPDTEFSFINAGIPSFGSTPGAFRLHKDVLSKGRVDLLFVEAAVNDSTNGRSPAEMTRGMEGIVRHLRRAWPRCDVVMMHFVDPGKMRQLNRGEIPVVIQRHEAVARQYGIPSLDLAEEVSARIQAGEFSWAEDFKNLHPSPFGQRLYARSIARLLDAAFADTPQEAPLEPLPMPPALDPQSYSEGRMLPPGCATDLSGTHLVESWRPAPQARTRPGFVGVPMLVATEPGASLRFAFWGRAVGILVNAGPDAGQVEYRVDDGPWQSRELFTRWSAGLHLPWSHVLATGLAPGDHVLELRVARSRHPRSRGHALRIAWFLVDGTR